MKRSGSVAPWRKREGAWEAGSAATVKMLKNREAVISIHSLMLKGYCLPLVCNLFFLSLPFSLLEEPFI